MHRYFPSCLFVQDGSNVPELELGKVSPHSGNTLLPDQGERNVLLAGGFSSITTKSGFPLSPTLQLNFDLATLGVEDLAAVARAELNRINAVDYRSYTVEADKRVCVVADNAEQLHAFLDTYGGVLEIEPLLVKGSHPELETAIELKIDTQGQKYCLEYQVRFPIDYEICNYCGDCGPACPEQCISEALFINYDLCTLCRGCEKACPAKAIDIHGALTKILEVPALIVVGHCNLDLPEETGNVFYEANLADYFATLFPCRIDEVISCNKALCQYNGNLDRGCDLCLTSCPHGAIIRDERGVTVDSFKCEECGACVASCPTGALQNERFSDAAFAEYLNGVDLPPGGTVVVGGEKDLHALWWRQRGTRLENVMFLQYDPVSSLSLYHFLFLLSRGVRRIVILQDQEESRGKAAARKQLDLANELLAGLYGIEDAVISCHLHEFDALLQAPLTGTFVTAAGNDATVAVPNHTFINRRQALIAALEALVKNSGRKVTIPAGGNIPFATVSCDSERCTECMACLRDCRIEAMRADPMQLTLNNLGAMCVGCGLCVYICPENALSITSECTLDSEFFEPVELARAEAMACKECGKVFGTKKSYEKVMAILSEKETVDTSHFEYCDTCRVVKLFEAV